LPSWSRKKNIGGTGSPMRMTSASTSTPRACSAAWSASMSSVANGKRPSSGVRAGRACRRVYAPVGRTRGSSWQDLAMPDALPELILPDAAAWRAWLGTYHEEPGVWLVLAKKGHTEPTALTYDEALDEALCHGWIDGQVRRRDERTYRQRFTPRRARSQWSERNVGKVERLLAEGKMHPAGLAAVAQAYPGQASIEVPTDLADALAAEPLAQTTFEGLSSQNRYAVLYRIHSAKRSDTRARRIERFVEMLARGEAIHPQGPV
jgi:uncharacterized protein YdeI (YjbR/CyaY-like superfamily)